MIETKFFEIRDKGTMMPIMVNKVWRNRESDPDSHWLLGKAGFGSEPCYIMTILTSMKCEYNPFEWEDRRTLYNAHRFLCDSFEFLSDGQVIDVEYILQETDEPKQSERQSYQEAVNWLEEKVASGEIKTITLNNGETK